MDKTYQLTFHKEGMKLKKANVLLTDTKKIENILLYIEGLHEKYAKEIKATNFESDTDKFLRYIVEPCIGKTFINCEQLLKYLVEEIKLKLFERMRHRYEDYAHDVKITSSSINIEKQTINIKFRNNDDDRALRSIIFVKTVRPGQKLSLVKISITTKIGFTIFNYAM